MCATGWQAQIVNFYLNYQTITLQGYLRLALHKFRPQHAFLQGVVTCMSPVEVFVHDANFPSHMFTLELQ